MTIREDALAAEKTALFESCAACENLDVGELMAGVARGTIAIPKNVHHDFSHIMAIGTGTSTKINANIGSSKDIADLDTEVEKLNVAVRAGAIQ
jgi:phosphomethylpyrimidine synthase